MRALWYAEGWLPATATRTTARLCGCCTVEVETPAGAWIVRTVETCSECLRGVGDRIQLELLERADESLQSEMELYPPSGVGQLETRDGTPT